MKHRPLIGIAAPVLARNHIAGILRGALKQAAGSGCDTVVLAPLVHFTQGNAARAQDEREIYRLIASKDFDGFLYIRDDTTMGTEVIAYIEDLLMHSDRYVMTVDEKAHPVFDTTQYDDYYDFCKVTEHLIEVHGFRKIYCLTGPKGMPQAESRLRAYQDMMQKHGLYFDESYYTYGTFWVDSAQEYALRLVTGQLALPQAIVCGNDITAMSVIKCLLGAGIRVPEDVAVTGYDGFPFAANIDVTLTTYARDHEQLGADAVRRLLRNITGTLAPAAHSPANGFLIGSSCGCTSVPAAQLTAGFSANTPMMWQEDVFADDLAYDLAEAQSLDDLMKRALRHSYILYQAEEIRLYLRAEHSGSAEPLLRLAAVCRADCEPEIISGEAVPLYGIRRLLALSEPARTWFLSPLHLHRMQLGMIALSFGSHNRVYDRSYLHYVSDLTAALSRFLAPDKPAAPAAQGQRRHKNAALLEQLAALRNRMQQQPELEWTIDTICEDLQISKSALQKNYRKHFGRSIFEDLIEFRIRKAQLLLTETALTVTEISVRCGYSTESYFMKQFKRVTGSTPSEYRNRHA